jgi:hypothetical protein
MPIYDIFETEKEQAQPENRSRGSLFSSLAARLLFFVLLLGDIAWALYSLAMCLIFGPLNLLTFGKIAMLGRMQAKHWINLKRSGICGLSLVIALFSPALGIMIACTYFLMYDKNGIQEVVPRSLQDQFQDFLK